MATTNNTTKITNLLKKLAAAKPGSDEKKVIRRSLRKLGHKNGLGLGKERHDARKPKTQSKAKPAKRTASQNREQGRKEQEAYKAAKKVVTQEEYEAANG